MTLGVNLRKSKLKERLKQSLKMINLPIIVGAEIRNHPQEEAKVVETADFRADVEMAALEAVVAKIAGPEVEAATIEEDIEAVVAMITSEVAPAANTKLTTLTLEGAVGAIGAVAAVVASTAKTTTVKVVADIAADSTTQKVAEGVEMVDSEEVEAELTSILTMTSMERVAVQA